MLASFFSLMRLTIIVFLLYLASQIMLVHLYTPHEQISWHADSWLAGRLDSDPKTQDYVQYKGKYYWQLSPFPTVVMLPFRFLFKDAVSQGIVQLFVVGLIAFLSYQLALLKKFSKIDSFYIMFSFLFASPLVGVLMNSFSWYFAQNIAVLLFLCLLYEFETTKRPLLLGLFASLLLATRYMSALIIVTIPIYYYFQNKGEFKKTIYELFLFFLPITFVLILLSLYNYVRFDNIFETGVAINNVGGELPSLRNYGVFSLTHIPSNLYYYFLTSVEPITKTPLHLTYPYIKYSKTSLSILLVSPFFLLAFRTIRSSVLKIKILWITVSITFAALLCYYAPGLHQYGTRYALDFFPIIFILLLYSFKQKKLSSMLKSGILLSAAFNIYLLYTSY